MQTPTDWKLESEFHEPFQTWQRFGDSPESNNRLLTAISPMIDRQLQRFNEADRVALRPQAKIIAMKSMKRYNPSQTNLNTWLSLQMQGLNRVHRKQQAILKVPEKVQYDAQRITDAETYLTGELGYPPTTIELSDYLKMSPKKIEYIAKHNRAVNSGRFVGETEDSPLTDPAIFSPVAQDVKISMIYPDLNRRDQLILEHTLGLYGKRRLPVDKLAKKLGVSTATISQRRAAIQAEFDKTESLLR